MIVKVKLFAAARDAAGQSDVEIELPDDATVGTLRGQLVAVFSGLKSLQHVLLVALNNDFADDTRVVTEADEVACFPPVSGG